MYIILVECNDEVHLQTTDEIMLNQKQCSCYILDGGDGVERAAFEKRYITIMLPAGSLSNWIKSMV